MLVAFDMYVCISRASPINAQCGLGPEIEEAFATGFLHWTICIWRSMFGFVLLMKLKTVFHNPLLNTIPILGALQYINLRDSLVSGPIHFQYTSINDFLRGTWLSCPAFFKVRTASSETTLEYLSSTSSFNWWVILGFCRTSYTTCLFSRFVKRIGEPANSFYNMDPVEV